MSNFLNVVYNWFTVDELSPNLDKPVFMSFINHLDCKPMCDISINECTVKEVSVTKFLLDNRLKWDKPVEARPW